jgi:hypothetical protein
MLFKTNLRKLSPLVPKMVSVECLCLIRVFPTGGLVICSHECVFYVDLHTTMFSAFFFFFFFGGTRELNSGPCTC